MTTLEKILVDAFTEMEGHHKPHWYNINPAKTSSFDLWDALGLSTDEFRRLLLDLNWASVRGGGSKNTVCRFKPTAIETFIMHKLNAPGIFELTRSKPNGFDTQTYFLRVGTFQEMPFTTIEQFDPKITLTCSDVSRLPMASISTSQHLKSLLNTVQSTLLLDDSAESRDNDVGMPETQPAIEILAQNQTFEERLSAAISQEIASMTWKDQRTLRTEPTDTLATKFSELLLRKKNNTAARNNRSIFGIASPVAQDQVATPKLDQYHVPFDPREHNLLLKEILSLQQQPQSSFRVCSVLSANNTARDILIVPRSKGKRVNEVLLKSLLESSEITIRMLVTLCCRIDVNEFLLGLKDAKLAPPKKLSPEQLAALMKAANLSQHQMRTIRRMLNNWLPCKIFPSEKKLLETYADDGYEPYIDVATIDNKNYYFSYKLPDELLEFHLVRYLEQAALNMESARSINKIELVVLADHGKGSFCMITTILLYSGNNVIHKEHVSTGNVETAEDSVRLMRETFVTKVNNSLRMLEEAGSIVLRGLDMSFMANLSTRDDLTDERPIVSEIPVLCFLNGDIKFLANCLGKERMAGKHCYLCQLSCKEWAEPNHEPGPPWTQASLKAKWEQVLNAQTAEVRLQPSVVHGVTGPAIIDAIPVSRVGVPQLHIELGMGKQILYNRVICDYIFPLFVRLNPNVYDARRYLYMAKKAVSEACATESDTNSIRELTKTVNVARKRLHDALKDTKYMNDPVIVHIEEAILLKYNIKRSSYHGGDPEGPACRSFFKNAEQVLTSIAVYLCTLEPVFPVSAEQIHSFFNANARLVQHLDAITSFSRTIGVTDDGLRECAAHVSRFCSLYRKLGYSVEMVKFHLIETHLVDTIRTGNACRLEDEMEHFHQKASKFDKRSSLKDGPRKHLSFSNAEKRDNNLAVQQLIDQTMKESGRKRRRETSREAQMELQAERSYLCANILTLTQIEASDAFNVDKIIIQGL